jgi:hypothetical protein
MYRLRQDTSFPILLDMKIVQTSVSGPWDTRLVEDLEMSRGASRGLASTPIGCRYRSESLFRRP